MYFVQSNFSFSMKKLVFFSQEGVKQQCFKKSFESGTSFYLEVKSIDEWKKILHIQTLNLLKLSKKS